jgi:HlyD family secretion protein
MRRLKTAHRSILFYICCVIVSVGILAGCNSPPSDRVQGYVEGEFVYVASPFPGELKSLSVRRGMQAKTGDPLFALEESPEKEARDEARKRLAQAGANLEDLRKGKRPTEIEALEAQLRQAGAALLLSEKELARQERLLPSKATSAQDVDRARSAFEQDRQRVSQIEADLRTAHLGARSDQIAAAEENLRAMETALAKSDWDLSQKRQSAPRDGLVFDTLYRIGEWVGAGRPVVALLPPGSIKVRAFVPETWIGKIQPGQKVSVIVDGTGAPLAGKVSFISPQAEYTPPVIFSKESRSKLVFMTEIVFDPDIAANLHPGQPVDVQFGLR